jgi:SAM-dependent methyltransferase
VVTSPYARLSGVEASNERLELQASGEAIESMVAGLMLERCERILEIGCGTGALTREIARQHRKAIEVVGIDLASSHVDRATTLAAQANLNNVRFMRADGRSPPEELLGSFDAVMARYVFMYAMADGSAADLLSGMIRCLRPGGALLLIEPDINFGAHMHPPPAEPLASVMRDVVHYYRQRGSIEWRAGIRLFELMTNAGFEGVELKLLDCRIIQGGRPRALAEHDGLDLEALMAPVIGCAPEAAIAGDLARQWRRLLGDSGSFIYSPIFVARWSKPSGSLFPGS